ncbi:MAG TPA: hypothetical protein VH062_02285 [Polyangiaceae bacterium]|jgi:hypothetical protein|nr:hypothetical protein [Polyangiaceae bacterium]
MKLSPTLLPGDAAALLEAELPMLDAIERAATSEEREAALATTRAWLVSTAAQLRQQDPRAARNPVPAPSAPKAAPVKAPCDCSKKVPTVGATLGERLARAALERFFPSS